jgi:hypothetical protein
VFDRTPVARENDPLPGRRRTRVRPAVGSSCDRGRPTARCNPGGIDGRDQWNRIETLAGSGSSSHSQRSQAFAGLSRIAGERFAPNGDFAAATERVFRG